MKLTYEIIKELYPDLRKAIQYDLDGEINCNHCHKNKYELFEHTQTMICPECGDELHISIEDYYKWTQNKNIKQRIDNLENSIIPINNSQN